MTPSRYIRQEILPLIGPEGQARVQAASAAVVGCGALGTHIANSLVRSGIGHLSIIDPDVVELDNLQRQMLFDERHVREQRFKADAAAERLSEINSTVRIEPHVAALTPKNAADLLSGSDILLDGTDNVAARLVMNDSAFRRGIPYVFGGAVGTTGMVMPVVPGKSACYRCLMDTLPEPGTTPTAATAGILNATVAVVAALECAHALRLLTGSPGQVGEVMCIDVWDMQFTTMAVPRLPGCPACGRGGIEAEVPLQPH